MLSISVGEGSCVYQNTIQAYDGNLAPLSLQIYSVCLWDQLSGSLLCQEVYRCQPSPHSPQLIEIKASHSVSEYSVRLS